MAKRKRLSPARLPDTPQAAPEVKSALARPALSARPPIADVAHDAAASAALTEVAQELSAARAEGRLIQKIKLDAIEADHLVRDRMVLDAADMQALMDSLRDRGQQTPIEVSALPEGRYGLISGFRRYAALCKLAVENPGLDSILAVVRRPKDAADAYQAMVEENEVRVGLSFYERARIVARAADAGVFRTDALALSALFAHVPRARRSKIKAFITVVRALDDVLRFPAALSEKQGLALAKALTADASLAPRLTGQLRDQAPQSAAAETTILAQEMRGDAPASETASPARLELQPGLKMVQHANGKVELTGAKLSDPTFVARLMKVMKNLR